MCNLIPGPPTMVADQGLKSLVKINPSSFYTAFVTERESQPTQESSLMLEENLEAS